MHAADLGLQLVKADLAHAALATDLRSLQPEKPFDEKRELIDEIGNFAKCHCNLAIARGLAVHTQSRAAGAESVFRTGTMPCSLPA